MSEPKDLPADPPGTAPTGSAPVPTHIGRLFARVAASLRPAIPFDIAALALVEDAESLRVVSVEAGAEAPPSERAAGRSAFSERLWPAGGEPARIDDTAGALDPSKEEDRRLIAAGARSVLALPLAAERRPLGLLVLGRRSAGAFAGEPPPALAPVLELLAAAADHERLWKLERARQKRREKLEELLPAIAGALDVRQVFLGMSPIIREIVPHDILAFSLLSPDRRSVRVQAATHEGLREMPEYRFSNDEEALDANWQFLLGYELTPAGEDVLRARITPRDAPVAEYRELRPGLPWVRFIGAAGLKSSLRVPIRAKDRPIGGVAFLSRRPDAYDEEDGALAFRIADHIALALAHQELAEEEKRIAKAEERALHLEQRVGALSRELERFSARRVLGTSASWKKALADATQVAATDTTVLITGESGTGKEVVARFVHRGSRRAEGPFVALNCAALPEQLLESELFGHERGAFTGALSARAGRLEQAAGGVLFLDEVGEMSPAVQAKFLRVLQEREFQRVGGARTLRADVRVVAATNRDPRKAMESGAFREDLYYRLSVFEIHLPPLRERPEDILELAEGFLEEIGESIGRPAAGISEDARDLLLAHPWPGNVRELRNAVERAVILCHGGLITREHLPVAVGRAPSAAAAPERIPPEGVKLEAVERGLIQKALARARNNKSEAARLLGLTRGQLYSLLRKHGLTDAKR